MRHSLFSHAVNHNMHLCFPQSYVNYTILCGNTAQRIVIALTWITLC